MKKIYLIIAGIFVLTCLVFVIVFFAKPKYPEMRGVLIPKYFSSLAERCEEVSSSRNITSYCSEFEFIYVPSLKKSIYISCRFLQEGYDIPFDNLDFLVCDSKEEYKFCEQLAKENEEFEKISVNDLTCGGWTMSNPIK